MQVLHSVARCYMMNTLVYVFFCRVLTKGKQQKYCWSSHRSVFSEQVRSASEVSQLFIMHTHCMQQVHFITCVIRETYLGPAGFGNATECHDSCPWAQLYIMALFVQRAAICPPITPHVTDSMQPCRWLVSSSWLASGTQP